METITFYRFYTIGILGTQQRHEKKRIPMSSTLRYSHYLPIYGLLLSCGKGYRSGSRTNQRVARYDIYETMLCYSFKSVYGVSHDSE